MKADSSAPHNGAPIGHFGTEAQRDEVLWDQYLQERTNKGDSTFIVPGWEIVTEVVQSSKIVSHKTPQLDGWNWWLPGGRRTHGLVLAGSIALQALAHNFHNVPKIGADLVEEGQQLQDAVEDYAHEETITIEDVKYEPPVFGKVERKVPGKEENVEGFCASPLGETSIDPECTIRALDEVQALIDYGYTLESASVRGGASDDYGQDGLATPNPDNNEYAESRAVEWERAVEERFGVDVKKSFSEVILREDVANLIRLAVERFGYDSQNQVEQLYKDPASRDSLPPGLKELMDIQIGKSAGVVYSFNLKGPDGKVEELVLVSGAELDVKFDKDLDDGEPNDQNKDYGLDLWPIIPIPIPPIPITSMTERSEVKTKTKTRRRLRKIDGQLPDTTWLEMSDEVLAEVEANGGKLGRDAWRFTRKYMYLMAKGRMKAVQSVKFNNSENGDLDLNIAYIDHVPTQETQDAFAKALESFTALKDGKIAKDLGLIAVYPNKNCGRGKHKEKIGLGIDRQYKKSTALGVAMGNIGLVEVRMPDDATVEDLVGDGGTLWTLVHEVAGHFTDLKKDGSKLVKSSGRNRYIATSPWKDTASRLYRELKASSPKWKITRNVNDRAGKPRELTWDIEETEDVRLTEGDVQGALKIEKHGMVTEYGGTNAGELWAELAAAVVTREEIRLREAGLPRGFEGLDGFAQGYVPSEELIRFFEDETRSVGETTNVALDIAVGDLSATSIAEFIEWATLAGYPKGRIKLLGHDLSQLGRISTLG